MVEIWAEPGGTHEGRYSLLLALLDAAALAGATTFKAQWVSDPTRLCARRHAPDYLADYRKIAYPSPAWHLLLRLEAERRGLRYACSIYLPEDAAAVAPYVDAIKVAAFEGQDAEVLDAAVATGRPVVASLGMGGRPQDRPGVRWLACTSAYPAPRGDLHLRRVASLAGYSDHSRDVRVGAWAVCAGASIVEAHLRLDDCDPANKDYAVAFTPAEFAEYVRHIRDAEQALGEAALGRVRLSEEPMTRYRVTR